MKAVSIGSKSAGAAKRSITVEFKPSNTLVQAIDGENISELAAKAGVEIKHKCRKGECGTCQVRVNEKWVKACQTSVSMPDDGGILMINVKPITAKEQADQNIKKKAEFFSPQSFLDGIVNNGLGVVGFVCKSSIHDR